jgi:hypothetical protein
MALVRAKASLVKNGRHPRQRRRSAGYVLCKFRVVDYSFPTFLPAKHLYLWCPLSQSPFDSEPQHIAMGLDATALDLEQAKFYIHSIILQQVIFDQWFAR